jgi:hypothetical protein
MCFSVIIFLGGAVAVLLAFVDGCFSVLFGCWSQFCWYCQISCSCRVVLIECVSNVNICYPVSWGLGMVLGSAFVLPVVVLPVVVSFFSAHYPQLASVSDCGFWNNAVNSVDVGFQMVFSSFRLIYRIYAFLSLCLICIPRSCFLSTCFVILPSSSFLTLIKCLAHIAMLVAWAVAILME